MQLTVNDLAYSSTPLTRDSGLKAILQRNGFGLVEATDARDDVVHVDLWTATGDEGAEGFPCGRVVRDFGSFPKFTLMLDSGRLSRSRIHGVLTDILNANLRD